MNAQSYRSVRMKAMQTGVWIFLVTLIGVFLSVLAGFLISQGMSGSVHDGLVDGMTVASELAIAVGSITLVWFFLWEGAQMTKTMRSSAYSAINERFQDLSKAMLDGCESRDWYADPPMDDASLSKDSRAYLCDMAFTMFEEVYYHRIEFELLDDENWESWRRSLKTFVHRPYVRKYWTMVRGQYSASFSKTIDAIIQEKSGLS